MSKDREYIEGLFENDGIKAPESLSEEKMLAMLEAAEDEKVFETRRAVKRAPVKKIAAMAAAVLIAMVGIGGLAKVTTAPPDVSVADGQLYTFKNEQEINKILSDLNKSVYRYDTDTVLEEGEMLEYEGAPADAVSNDMDAGATTGMTEKSVTSSADSSHSETYLQVDDVDEADIVKTDGKYIYYVNTDREVVILSAKDGKTKKVSTIGNNGVENYISDIYIKGDKLITVGTYYPDDSEEGFSGIVVYDISDRSKPSVLYDFSQTGSILSSRMVGDYVYLVTNDYVYRDGRILPKCGSSDSIKSLDATEICCMPKPEMSSFIVLSGIDISSGKQGKATTKAILGASSEIYCNDHSLYVTASEWDDKTEAYYTRIVRAGLDGPDVRFNTTARVRGYVISQFAMDERDGYFRIATTSERGGVEVNNLFVLDPDLKESGKVTGFARNESIRAVRYIGEKAYVITYEEIDPLFIIDLSDPADPRIEGEVKIDGFSTLLIPVGEGRLLGIGHATGDNGYGGEFDSGLKLALFDISDPSEPKVIDSKEFKDMSSLAQDDHHALMVNSEAGYFAIPYDIWDYSYTDPDETVVEDNVDEEPEWYYESGLLIFKAKDKISKTDQHKLGSEQIFRSVYIGDWIYALDGDGNVSSFKPSV